MPTVEAPPARRYRLVILNVENRRSNMGRHHIEFQDGETLVASASLREGTEVRFTLTVTEIVRQGSNAWELIGDDGAKWRLSGCGCGGG